MRRHLVGALALAMIAGLGRQACAIIYLGENSLESLLVRCPVVVIGTAVSTDPSEDQAVIRVEKTLQGNAKGEVTVNGVMRKISAREKKVRFGPEDRVLLFLGQDKKSGTLRVVASQTLAGEKEAKAMEGCVTEVMPLAAVLADLANMKKAVDETAVREAMGKLVTSENEYTKILVGRLMGTKLSERVKPERWDDLILAGLQSKRKELRKGALAWAEKYKELPAAVREVVEKMAKETGEDSLAAEAKKVLKK